MGLSAAAIAATLAGCPPCAPIAVKQPGSEVDGDYTHEATGSAFPETAGRFRRTKITEYDEAGSNISVGYNLVTPELSMSATVYVYPLENAESLDAHFDLLKAEIVDAHKGAEVFWDNTSTKEIAGDALPYRRAAFGYISRFAHMPGAVTS
jgi:hypothetical protein